MLYCESATSAPMKVSNLPKSTSTMSLGFHAAYACLMKPAPQNESLLVAEGLPFNKYAPGPNLKPTTAPTGPGATLALIPTQCRANPFAASNARRKLPPTTPAAVAVGTPGFGKL